MTELSDERINQLLTEAESRLAKVPLPWTEENGTGRPAVTVDGDNSVESTYALGKSKSLPNQKLAVREARLKPSLAGQDNAGPGWFGLPKTDPNDKELKRDMQLLQMRGTALDPKRHYKKDSLRARVPRYAQVGRIIEGPTDFFSARLTRRERKRTLVDELLAAEKQSGKFRAKYDDIQARKTSGKKAYYKKLMAQRRRRN